ncbi:MAG: 2,3-bisphosphoglycerate-independent phosphoglycerate mutase [Patescibacteria group bacterium]
MSKKSKKHLCQGPAVLLIWDGFGISKSNVGNAVKAAKMSVWQKLWADYPHCLLKSDGEAVGLPQGETGNSEVGHTTIGAGRAVESDKVRINQAIQTGNFENNPAFVKAALHALRHRSTLHLMGLLTNHQSGHADFGHIVALVNFAKRLNLPKVALHLFTDGRDTAPFHAAKLVMDLEKHLSPQMKIATIIGRFYAMDRDHNWQRTSLAYDAMTKGMGLAADSAVKAIEQAYGRGESDEFIVPTVIVPPGEKPLTIEDKDAVIFWNLRSDRARQMIKPFIQHDFEDHNARAFRRRKVYHDLYFATMTEFGKQIDGAVAAFPHQGISGTIVEALRSNRQIYISESEKYSQVTYFLNGGSDAPRFGEERIRIPSIRTATFENYPRMRAKEISHEVIKAIRQKFDFICANFANADMVGHTGNYVATIKACEELDDPLAKIWSVVQKGKGHLFVVADHGNAEQLFGPHGERDTHHNANLVPFLAAGPLKSRKMKNGTLADVAPTILKALCVSMPDEMKGRDLIV